MFFLKVQAPVYIYIQINALFQISYPEKLHVYSSNTASAHTLGITIKISGKRSGKSTRPAASSAGVYAQPPSPTQKMGPPSSKGTHAPCGGVACVACSEPLWSPQGHPAPPHPQCTTQMELRERWGNEQGAAPTGRRTGRGHGRLPRPPPSSPTKR